jgi:small subunit ribosomal protein S1
VGDAFEGVIKNITDYALFVSIKNTELDGMIHYKDLNWSEKDTELEKYKKNQQIKFKILEINQENEKIRLGIKQLSNDPFEFFMNKNLSDIVTVVVDYSTQNGIYAKVGKKSLSILIKKNQLAIEAENQRPSRFVKGDKLDVIITELNKEKRKVSLSIKALEEKQTKEAVKKYGSKDSGGILGEILEPLLRKKPKSKK